MRFEFCGNISCPQWFIAEISALTKITAIKMKLVFTQLVNYYLDGEDISAKTVKLLTGTGLDVYEINAVVSTLNFILHNAVQFHVTDAVLNKELIDLGLPKQNVQSITKTYKSNRQKLLQKSIQKLPKSTKHIQIITSSIQVQYSIHDFLGSSRLGSSSLVPQRFSQININYKDMDSNTRQNDFIMNEQDIDGLIFELEEVLSIAQKIQSSK